MWLWFVVPNIIVLQPWPWDNTKFFIFWALLGSVLVGGVLAGLLRAGRVAVTAAVAMMVPPLWLLRNCSKTTVAR